MRIAVVRVFLRDWPRHPDFFVPLTDPISSVTRLLRFVPQCILWPRLTPPFCTRRGFIALVRWNGRLGWMFVQRIGALPLAPD